MDGNAIVYCEAAFATPNGKTAHGLVRRTDRYRVVSVVDSTLRGQDAAFFLDRRPRGIPIVGSLEEALEVAEDSGHSARYFVIGLAPDGGRLAAEHREAVRQAILAGLNVDSGLHDFLSEDREIAALAAEHAVTLRDVRKPPPRDRLHFFSGKIEEVDSLRIALLGTDSAVGKRTTAWLLVDALRQSGLRAELVGTGQTAWMQGARHCVISDSLVSDFVTGEIEHAVWSAWSDYSDGHPDVIVIEGQGSLLNPAYPGGFEILAAGRPDVVVLQHAPAREFYDGFPGYRIHDLDRQIQAVEILSSAKVVAITINHEGLEGDEIDLALQRIADQTDLPVFDVLRDGSSRLKNVLEPYLAANERRSDVN